ncbi:VWA domain-containing protein [Sporosarcina trichiuri]|uniref:VWA domain-containing protein n=1 Tax=Sporosarcina trichiuri TaxID=3056445 RepID=UPI0025B43FF2|nr:VWA domain-containing protein [Sporosarcina sp. 0.2-SM1T-5]WJY27553.1 VWA domain-containing protein [Sporosarcina sp. 0.2-SM1T-5]
MKKVIWLLFCSFVVLAGCSAKEETPKSAEAQTTAEKEPAKPTEQEESSETADSGFEPAVPEYYELEGVGRELTSVEKELLRKPGIYAGDRYDEQKVQEALRQLPGDLTKEEYLNEMLHLLGEDYQEGMKTYLTFDPTVKVDLERPDGNVEQPKLKKAHYAILIDASGSMKATVAGKTRMESAKEAVLDFAKQIPEDATVSMRVYGHKGSGNRADKELSCTSTESFYNGKFEEGAFREALNNVKPAGWTPIGLVLDTVKEDIPPEVDEAVVYVVSDGIETCGGDPVKAASGLVAGNIQTVVNIIGYDVDNEGQTLLKKVADAGNGEFIYVNSEKELKRYMKEQYEIIQQQWWEWKEAGKEDAWAQKEDLKELARTTKETLQEQVIREKERLVDARQFLRDTFDDNDSIIELSNYIIDKKVKKYNYVTMKGQELYNESIKNGQKEYHDVIKEGQKNYYETIQEKNKQ